MQLVDAGVHCASQCPLEIPHILLQTHCVRIPLTSVHAHHEQAVAYSDPTLPSRGALTTDFLLSHDMPLSYLRSLEKQRFTGFNLVVGDLSQRQLAYYCNKEQAPARELPPGLYGERGW